MFKEMIQLTNAYILFVNILVMLLYSLPGFVMVKSRLMKVEVISGFNVLLLYVTQPCLAYYALTKVEFEPRILLNMLYTFVTALVIMLGVIALFRLFTGNRQKESVAVRISNVSVAFGNCTFIGIPLLEAVLPTYPEAVVYSIVFFISMSVIGWTVASYIITGDKKYVSVKKIFLNPAAIGLAVSLPFFLTGVRLSSEFHNAVTLVGRMSTPICMLILGMRLATLSLKSVFADKSKYLTVIIRQLVVPLIYIAVCRLLPIEDNLGITLAICGSAPVAAVVLNYSELLGEGQEYAAGTIVLSNILSVFTLPLVILLNGMIS